MEIVGSYLSSSRVVSANEISSGNGKANILDDIRFDKPDERKLNEIFISVSTCRLFWVFYLMPNKIHASDRI